MKQKTESNGFEVVPTPSAVRLPGRRWTDLVEKINSIPVGKSIRVYTDNQLRDRQAIYSALYRRGQKVKIRKDGPNHLIATLVTEAS
jgi:hypothetical protein